MIRRANLDAMIAAASWLAGYVITTILASGMNAASAYAVIVGWWLTLYVSAKLTLHVLSAVPLFIGYFVVFIAATLAGQSWFYREATSLPFSFVVEIGVAQAFVIVSPILLEEGIRRVLDQIK